MLEYIKLAIRNLIRYKRRSILTGLGMLISCLILTLNRSCGAGIERQLIFNMIASDTGHIRITGHNEDQNSNFEEAFAKTRPLIENPAPIERKLAGQSGIKTFTKQVEFTGMVSNGFKLRSGMIIGIEPGKEQALLQQVIPVQQGKSLTDNDRYGIYISQSASKIFQVGVDDTLTVMTQTKNGGSNALDFTVKGVYRDIFKASVGAGNLYMLLSAAQELGQLGLSVNQIKVYLTDPDLAVTTSARLSKSIAREFKVDIRDWKSAGGFFFGTVMAFQVFGNILCLILFIVVATSIINTMLMAVYGRTREIGMLLAMGTKRRQILGLFVMEALVLGTIATGAGALLGSLFTWLLGKTGVPAATESMKFAFGGERFFPYLTLDNVLLSSLTIIGLTVLAALYPAWTASRLKPVEALHRT